MISLRDVHDSDLAFFWEHQSDPAAQHMAAVTRPYHHDREQFDAHWARIRALPGVLIRTVLADGEVVGSVSVYGPPEEREVTYWIDRAHWGRGIATAALSALLDLEPIRPVYAHAVSDNTGSIRVLQKCGFVITAHDKVFAESRAAEVPEVRLTLS
ncbi:GNAT family N-acetyltransferase [Streptomyces sp. NBC_01198]|uniref:GNAT family N-acetyltransferase n=1 Tax=Streptomyces sp. NBC_01198 TaxID=2903769 RepID=UPI002E0DA8A0|nr:GNAT family N-acetyltransferase [Streptomyces sp. NBC_01198]